MKGQVQKSWHRHIGHKRRQRGIYKSSQLGGRSRAFVCEQLEGRMLLAAAGTITWTGTVDGDWSTPGNWDLDRAPINGDSIVFPRTAQHLANNNDISGLSVNSIAFQGTFTTVGSGYILSGDDLTVGSGGIADNSIAIPPPGASAGSGSFSNQIDFNVALGAVQSWANNDYVNPTNDQLDSAGTVSLQVSMLDLATLSAAGPFNIGQQFVIVQAGAPISTTFAGLPEGGTVSDGMQNFTISYANDRVTLTALAAIGQTMNYLNGEVGDNTPATFVHNLYREVLGREVGAQEQATWVSVYNQTAANLGATAAQQTVVAGFLGSRENREHLVEIIYESFLHRAADVGGLAFWTADLAARMDEQSIVAGVVESDEYFNDARRIVRPDGPRVAGGAFRGTTRCARPLDPRRRSAAARCDRTGEPLPPSRQCTEDAPRGLWRRKSCRAGLEE